jgi:hypothetical protein
VLHWDGSVDVPEGIEKGIVILDGDAHGWTEAASRFQGEGWLFVLPIQENIDALRRAVDALGLERCHLDLTPWAEDGAAGPRIFRFLRSLKESALDDAALERLLGKNLTAWPPPPQACAPRLEDRG